MSRATTVCRAPTPDGPCPNLNPCSAHPATASGTAWSTSRRRQRTRLSGWEQQRRARRILTSKKHTDEDGFAVCHWCGRPGADQVDHVVPLAENGPDTDENLAPIHRDPCHQEKTAEEAARARESTPGGGV